MKAKLIKHDFGYNLVDTKDKWIATSKDDYTHAVNLDYWLSLKNCQEIERGHSPSELSKVLTEGERGAFEFGYCLAREHNSNKKYSEEDMIKFGEYCRSERDGLMKTKGLFNEFEQIGSLQQTEWEVIVEMEDIQEIHIDGVLTLQPKLDADGCLILRLL